MDRYNRKKEFENFLKQTNQSHWALGNHSNLQSMERHISDADCGRRWAQKYRKDLFTTLGLAVVQQQPETGKYVYNINNSTCKIKGTIATQFPHLVSRIGLSKTHVAKSKFHQKFTAKHQKGRRVPINLQPRVSEELERLQTEGHIKKLSSCSDEHFISPIVITVKKDQSI